MKNQSSITFKTKEEVWKNFDVSVVIPFYKKMAEFRRVFPLNRKYFERNGIEVVIGYAKSLARSTRY